MQREGNFARKSLQGLEARVGIEPTHKGFADLSLTTWVPRLRRKHPDEFAYKSWSGKRDSNPRLRPWQGRTLPLSYSRSPWRRKGFLLYQPSDYRNPFTVLSSTPQAATHPNGQLIILLHLLVWSLPLAKDSLLTGPQGGATVPEYWYFTDREYCRSDAEDAG